MDLKSFELSNYHKYYVALFHKRGIFKWVILETDKNKILKV